MSWDRTTGRVIYPLPGCLVGWFEWLFCFNVGPCLCQMNILPLDHTPTPQLGLLNTVFVFAEFFFFQFFWGMWMWQNKMCVRHTVVVWHKNALCNWGFVTHDCNPKCVSERLRHEDPLCSLSHKQGNNISITWHHFVNTCTRLCGDNLGSISLESFKYSTHYYSL